MISITEVIRKIVEDNGDDAVSLALTVVKEDRSYTGIIGVDPMRIGKNSILLVASMQAALDREFPITKAIIRGMECAGEKIMTPGETRTVEFVGEKQQKSSESMEAEKAIEKLLEEIFGNEGGQKDANFD